MSIWNKILISFKLFFYRSFGCVLYKLVEFERAFNGGNEYEIIKAILENPIPKINEPFLNSILKKFLFCLNFNFKNKKTCQDAWKEIQKKDLTQSN